jgi:hypothetical protein
VGLLLDLCLSHTPSFRMYWNSSFAKSQRELLQSACAGR